MTTAWLLVVLIHFFLGMLLWTNTINRWARYFRRKNRISPWFGGLMGLFFSVLTIPAWLITHALLFVLEGDYDEDGP